MSLLSSHAFVTLCLGTTWTCQGENQFLGNNVNEADDFNDFVDFIRTDDTLDLSAMNQTNQANETNGTVESPFQVGFHPDALSVTLNYDTLMPWWMVPLSTGSTAVAQFVLMGFDLAFKPNQRTWKDWFIKAVTTAPLTFMALNAAHVDTLRLYNVPHDSFPTFFQRSMVRMLLLITSANFIKSMTLWSGFIIQSPVPALDLKPSYPCMLMYGFPVSPWGAGWLHPVKWLYAMVLLPYVVVGGVIKFVFAVAILIPLTLPFIPCIWAVWSGFASWAMWLVQCGPCLIIWHLFTACLNSIFQTILHFTACLISIFQNILHCGPCLLCWESLKAWVTMIVTHCLWILQCGPCLVCWAALKSFVSMLWDTLKLWVHMMVAPCLWILHCGPCLLCWNALKPWVHMMVTQCLWILHCGPCLLCWDALKWLVLCGPCLLCWDALKSLALTVWVELKWLVLTVWAQLKWLVCCGPCIACALRIWWMTLTFAHRIWWLILACWGMILTVWALFHVFWMHPVWFVKRAWPVVGIFFLAYWSSMAPLLFARLYGFMIGATKEERNRAAELTKNKKPLHSLQKFIDGVAKLKVEGTVTLMRLEAEQNKKEAANLRVEANQTDDSKKKMGDAKVKRQDADTLDAKVQTIKASSEKILSQALQKRAEATKLQKTANDIEAQEANKKADEKSRDVTKKRADAAQLRTDATQLANEEATTEEANKEAASPEGAEKIEGAPEVAEKSSIITKMREKANQLEMDAEKIEATAEDPNTGADEKSSKAAKMRADATKLEEEAENIEKTTEEPKKDADAKSIKVTEMRADAKKLEEEAKNIEATTVKELEQMAKAKREEAKREEAKQSVSADDTKKIKKLNDEAQKIEKHANNKKDKMSQAEYKTSQAEKEYAKADELEANARSKQMKAEAKPVQLPQDITDPETKGGLRQPLLGQDPTELGQDPTEDRRCSKLRDCCSSMQYNAGCRGGLSKCCATLLWCAGCCGGLSQCYGSTCCARLLWCGGCCGGLSKCGEVMSKCCRYLRTCCASRLESARSWCAGCCGGLSKCCATLLWCAGCCGGLSKCGDVMSKCCRYLLTKVKEACEKLESFLGWVGKTAVEFVLPPAIILPDKVQKKLIQIDAAYATDFPEICSEYVDKDGILIIAMPKTKEVARCGSLCPLCPKTVEVEELEMQGLIKSSKIALVSATCQSQVAIMLLQFAVTVAVRSAVLYASDPDEGEREVFVSAYATTFLERSIMSFANALAGKAQHAQSTLHTQLHGHLFHVFQDRLYQIWGAC